MFSRFAVVVVVDVIIIGITLLIYICTNTCIISGLYHWPMAALMKAHVSDFSSDGLLDMIPAERFIQWQFDFIALQRGERSKTPVSDNEDWRPSQFHRPNSLRISPLYMNPCIMGEQSLISKRTVAESWEYLFYTQRSKAVLSVCQGHSRRHPSLDS